MSTTHHDSTYRDGPTSIVRPDLISARHSLAVGNAPAHLLPFAVATRDRRAFIGFTSLLFCCSRGCNGERAQWERQWNWGEAEEQRRVLERTTNVPQCVRSHVHTTRIFSYGGQIQLLIEPRPRCCPSPFHFLLFQPLPHPPFTPPSPSATIRHYRRGTPVPLRTSLWRSRHDQIYHGRQQ